MRLSEIINGTQKLTEIKNIQFEKEYDVIVCGLGTSGSLAAIFSAENGLKTLGIESFTCVGGVHSAGGVMQHYFENPGGRLLIFHRGCDTFNIENLWNRKGVYHYVLWKMRQTHPRGSAGLRVLQSPGCSAGADPSI